MIYYLRQDDVSEAYTLIKARHIFFSKILNSSNINWLLWILTITLTNINIVAIIIVITRISQDLEPTVPQEYILKGVVNAAVGQVISLMKNNLVMMKTP